MKIILLKNVPKLGKKNEVKDVAEGFARNYLFPRELAKPARQHEVVAAKKRSEKERKKAEEALARAQELASQLDGVEIEITKKVSSQGEAYAAVTKKEIIEALGQMGHEVKSENIKIPKSIKHVGEHPALFSFNDGIEAEITVVVRDTDPEH